jgi:hypothetical protein
VSPVDAGRIGTHSGSFFSPTFGWREKKSPETRPNVSRLHSAAGGEAIASDVIEEAHFAKGIGQHRAFICSSFLFSFFAFPSD